MALKINIARNQNYYTDIEVSSKKLKLKILTAIKECLISVIIRLSQNTMMIQTNYSSEK